MGEMSQDIVTEDLLKLFPKILLIAKVFFLNGTNPKQGNYSSVQHLVVSNIQD